MLGSIWFPNALQFLKFITLLQWCTATKKEKNRNVKVVFDFLEVTPELQPYQLAPEQILNILHSALTEKST